MDIYSFGEIYVAILHRDMPDIIVPLIKEFLVHLKQLMNNMAIDSPAIWTDLSVKNKLRKIFEEDICSKIC